jgi:hypothetical protein
MLVAVPHGPVMSIVPLASLSLVRVSIRGGAPGWKSSPIDPLPGTPVNWGDWKCRVKVVPT